MSPSNLLSIVLLNIVVVSANSASNTDREIGFLHEKSKYRVIMLRHGESEWNAKKLYTGWYDSKLTPKGRHQCKLAGQILDKFNLKIDQAYTSELSRSQDSVEEILRELDQKETVKVQKSWRMNERHYGALTGTPKNTTHFQRSFYVAPEPMSSTHPYWQSIAGHPAYAELVAAGTLPRTESLQDAYDRMIPYWNSTILPQILAGQIILISSHSNTIRSHIKHLDHLDGLDAAVIALKNCVPIIYEFDKNMRVVVSKKYLE